jgi:hypothetical protein
MLPIRSALRHPAPTGREQLAEGRVLLGKGHLRLDRGEAQPVSARLQYRF